MHFTSGRHLVNYLLKIFKNNEIDISEDCIDSIKDLSKIFTYIENLPKDTKISLIYQANIIIGLHYHKMENIKIYLLFLIKVMKILQNSQTIHQLFLLMRCLNHLD